MNLRAKLVAWAQEQVDSSDRAGYWLKALGSDPGKEKHWCGAFCLAGMREVGLTTHRWGIDGSGFVGPLRLPIVRRPEPGDIGYQHNPFQHHFLVESVDQNTYTSIDGNQGTPGVQRRHRAFKTTGVQFYSLSPLLTRASDTDPAPPPRRPVLRLGASGQDVRTVQNILNSHGAQLVVDGRMGPVTVLAVQSFQRRAGLDADGVVGAKTWAALEAV
jgi:hypothetical protein